MRLFYDKSVMELFINDGLQAVTRVPIPPSPALHIEAGAISGTATLRSLTIWPINPRCVERFAEGLDFHWQEGRREEYIRHANIEQRAHPTPYARSCDFPRHGGFYILDWAYAWLKTHRAEFLDQIRVMLDYWWDKRDERGLLLIESRSPVDEPRFHNINAPGQTVSLAASLLETAELLAAQVPELAVTMRERAAVYIDGFFAVPHDL